MSNVFSSPAELKQPWDRFAEADPYTYILTSLKHQDMQEFWRSGQHVVNRELLPLIKSRQISTGCAMELGCGVGRLALPLTSSFREVWGVDIAEGMVRRAQHFAVDKRIDNAHFAAVSGPADLLHQVRGCIGRIDFVYSLLVFQHISDSAAINGYLRVISALLATSGIAYLQFDTRPRNVFYHLKSNLPDFLLPRFWRKGIRRIRRSPQELQKSIRAAGLHIIEELTPSTDYHRYVLRRTDRSRHEPFAST
jgi:cyclopropane fatty-acyl-phospholipid synthase-like methyltransferase